MVEEHINYYPYRSLDNSFTEVSQNVFVIETYSTSNATEFTSSLSCYDDCGNLLYSAYWDYNKELWVPATYGYNNYGQLIWAKDANGSKTNYLSDEWDRFKKVTDLQGNYHAFSYDLYQDFKDAVAFGSFIALHGHGGVGRNLWECPKFLEL
ncbi:MAG TPA: hypothetical protein DCZ10_15265 [Pelotomaculum sp.]|nr:hypothetical protein [Pelotomaculum sp.]